MPLPLISANALVLGVPEPDSLLAVALNTMRRATPFQFSSTATTSTTVTAAAAFTLGTATNYVGCILEAMDGAAQGQRRRITVNGVGVVTVAPAFAPTPTAVTTWRLWIPPDPIAVASGVTTATSIPCVAIDDGSGRPGRDEAADYWNTGGATLEAGDRFMLVGVAGTNVNRAALILDFLGGTFTVEAGVFAAGVAGDLYTIRKLLRIFGGEFGLPEAPQSFLRRRYIDGSWDGQTGIASVRSGGTYKETLEVSRLAASSATGGAAATAIAPALPPQEGDLLESLCTATQDGSAAILTTGATTPVSTTLLSIGNGLASRFRVGDGVLVNGDMAWVVDAPTSDGTQDLLRVSPSLTQVPVEGAGQENTVYGGWSYAPKTTSYRTHTREFYLGGGPGRRHVHGWLPGFTLEGMSSEGEILRFVFTGPYDQHWTDALALPSFTTAAGGRLPTATPLMPQIARAARAHLAPAATDNAGANAATTFAAITLRGLSFNPGLNPTVRRAVTGMDGNDGCFMAGLGGDGAGGSITIDMENIVQLERFERGAVLEFAVQFGATPGATFGLWCRRIQITSHPIAIGDGMFQAEIPFTCLASQVPGAASSVAVATGAATENRTLAPMWVLTYC